MAQNLRDIHVHSWSDLFERLYENSWREELGRFRSNYVFRGLSDAGRDLRTKLIRLGGRYRELEYHLMRNFKKYARLQGTDISFSDWRWLSIAQHHGLPTRMLDWTYSPYVALHFATADMDNADVDGAVWCVDFVAAHKLLPRVFLKAIEEERSNAFTVEMLERSVRNLKDFDGLSAEMSQGMFVLFFEPPSLDERIVNQFALFSVMPDPQQQLDEWLEAHPQLCRRIIIRKELKWEIRDKLDQANITERVLFPGLDGLAKWLARYYGYGKNA